jgi:hypothetical protein
MEVTGCKTLYRMASKFENIIIFCFVICLNFFYVFELCVIFFFFEVGCFFV